MPQLLGSMHSKHSHSTDSTDLLLLLRDGMLFTLPLGGSALPYLTPTNKLSAGSKLHLIPDHTKNKKGGHCSITLTCDVLCFSTWLQLAVHHYSAAGQPITNHITRPLQVGSKVFAERAMSSSNACARLVKQLKELGMYQGQSDHSTRGGVMIHKQQQLQETCTEIVEAAMCNEKNVKQYTELRNYEMLVVTSK